MVSKNVSGFRPKDSPIYKDLPLTLEEVYNGAIKKLIIGKKVIKDDGLTFDNADKVLTVRIPPGSQEGMQFSFPGEGDHGLKNQPGMFHIEYYQS